MWLLETQSLGERADWDLEGLTFLLFSPAPCIADNVTLQIDGVLYLRIMDPYKVSGFCFLQLLMCSPR